MGMLYSAKLSKNYMSCIKMSLFKNHKKNIFNKKYLFYAYILEFLSMLLNLSIGITYIENVNTENLLESLVYGYLILEIPEFALR